jgi:hypothetical protein
MLVLPTVAQHYANWTKTSQLKAGYVPGSQLVAEHPGPLMQATVPTPATAAQLAVSVTFLLGDDGANVNAPSSLPTAAGRRCRGTVPNADGRRREGPPSSWRRQTS